MEGQPVQRQVNDEEDSEEGEFPWLSDEIEMRSAANIRSWRSYLSDECITTMIIMGWDQST